MKKIDVQAFALAWGISCGIYFLLIGWAAAMFNWGTPLVDTISSVYIGYAPTLLGGIIGGIWAFFDGAIGGAIIALIYNSMVKEK